MLTVSVKSNVLRSKEVKNQLDMVIGFVSNVFLSAFLKRLVFYQSRLFQYQFLIFLKFLN